MTSITISDSSGYTNSATPAITIVSSGSPTNVAFSCNGGTNWSDWITYASPISSFNITSGAVGCTAADGSKTITAKLKNGLGTESGFALDTTFYDTTGPTGSIANAGDDPTNDTTPTLDLTIADSGVGLTGAEMSFSCDNATWSSWEAYATPKTNFNIKPGIATYGCGTTDGARTVYIQFRDSLQNIGTSYNTDSFTLDTTAPTLTSLTISNSSGFTNSTTPTITIVSSGFPTYAAFSCNGGTNWSDWIIYTDAISSFDITNGSTGCNSSNGSKTITAKLKDSLGNESGTANDSIYYDITAPTSGSIDYADSYYTITSVVLTADDGSDGSGSGINTSSRIVQRKSAALTNGSCGTYGSFVTIAPTDSYPNFTDSTVVSGNCYQYQYLISDNLNNQTIYTSSSTAEVDTFGPTITSVVATSITNTGITITWTTGENSSSKVDYGLTNTYGSTTIETDTTTRISSHSVSLSSLVACSTYHYRVRSKDYALNETVDSDNTFITTGCTGSATVNSQASSQITTTAGGSLGLLSLGKGITLTVPASFAPTDANFQIKQLDSEPTGYSVIDPYIYDLAALSDISTKISTFVNPITVAIAYGSSDISGIDEQSLLIYQWDGVVWNQLSGCSVNTLAKTVTCVTSNFSVFGLFGQPTPTPTATPTPSPVSTSSSSSSSSSSSAPSCNDSTTKGVPNLFEIRTTKNSATLYFAPPAMPYSNFYIAYSRKTDIWEYAVQYDQGYSSGVLQYTIKSLQANTKYFFIIKPGNSCSSGNWSNIMSVNTTSGGQGRTHYKNFTTAIVQKTKALANKILLVPTPSPTPTQAPKVFVNIPTQAPQQIPVYPGPTVVHVAPKPKFCILWWCF